MKHIPTSQSVDEFVKAFRDGDIATCAKKLDRNTPWHPAIFLSALWSESAFKRHQEDPFLKEIKRYYDERVKR